MERVRPSELVTGWHRELIDVVSGHLHADQVMDAGRYLSKASRMTPPRTPEAAAENCWALVGWCLAGEHYADAATLLWPRNVFTPLPHATQLVWDNIHEHTSVMLQGAASMSKTFSAGVYFLLDWTADPENTTVRVVGPTQSHLQDNLFSHLIDMHARASLKMPGKVGELFIGLSTRQRRAGITGVIIPVGKSAAGRLQGVKRFPRKTPHLKWGTLSRLRVLMDEVEHIPVGVWSDVENLSSTVDVSGGFKLAVAYNPKNPAGPCGVRSEPPEGWGNLDEDKETWESRRGWRVVRLDAEKSENVVEGRTIYPGLQTKEGLDKLAKESGGRDTPGYYTFGRALFPREGASFTVIPAGLVVDFQGEYIWDGKTRRLGACDLALTGGDKPTFVTGLFGKAIGFRSHGKETRFLNSRGDAVSRTVLWAESMQILPRGDSVKMASQLRILCARLGIPPGWLMLDRTGHGQGVFDILQNSWSREVLAVNYSQSATDRHILFEDSEKCVERFDRIQSEIWFALKSWMEFDLIKHSPDISGDPLYAQLTGRKYEPRLKAKVEAKQEYKHRTSLPSPDEADAFTLLVHCARIAGNCTPGGLIDNADGGEDDDDGRPMDFIVDHSNVVDSL